MVECCPVWNLCGSIKLLLNGRPRASPRLDDLSAGRQARQRSERKHLNGVHVSFTACRHRPEKNKGLWCIQEERDSAPPPAYLPYHWDPGSQDGACMHRWWGILSPSFLSIGHLQRIMCEWAPAAVDVSLFTSDLSKDVSISGLCLKKKRDQGLRSCVNYPKAVGNTCRVKIWSENACDYIDLPIDGIPSLKLFIAALLGSFCRFHGFVILKNWVNLRNQDLNRICERKRGKASIL